ncbi:uncharacterized protein LOC132759570 [Ruditapes philippinarum]|uniref:uncharacterized protein LOC132759570 n=1 Tax=Ruditapes philippinarum TaxID=129788 RepID=UPI00295A9D45|nr:uncharacterized protein LOC132759570 [Ruditapes philippinarum]
MLFYFRWIIYFCGVLSFATQMDGYVCNSNQTMFVPEGTTANFQVNITGDILNKPFGFQKVLSSHMYIFSVNVTVDNQSFIQEYNHTSQHGVSIYSQLYSDNLLGIRFDLYNVSMQDNGTYVLYSQTRTCFTVFIMQITIAPIDFQEEHEPVNVYVHPHGSLIRRLLENVSMVLLIDGISVDQMTTCIQQDDLFWISSVNKGLHGKNITYRALLNDGIAIEINKTLIVRYGPSFPVTLIPRKIHYNLVSDDIMPDVTCTSKCNPSCNISWGEHGIGAILRLGRVSTTSTGNTHVPYQDMVGRH